MHRNLLLLVVYIAFEFPEAGPLLLIIIFIQYSALIWCKFWPRFSSSIDDHLLVMLCRRRKLYSFWPDANQEGARPMLGQHTRGNGLMHRQPNRRGAAGVARRRRRRRESCDVEVEDTEDRLGGT